MPIVTNYPQIPREAIRLCNEIYMCAKIGDQEKIDELNTKLVKLRADVSDAQVALSFRLTVENLSRPRKRRRRTSYAASEQLQFAAIHA
jgi:hypothetical protein